MSCPSRSHIPRYRPKSAGQGGRLQEATIVDIQSAFAASAPTCRQLVGLYPDRVRSHEDGGSRLNAITTVNLKAFEVAAALDAQRQSYGRMGSLHF